MNDLVFIEAESQDIVADSRIVANELGVEHRSIKDLIRTHSDRLGKVRPPAAPSEDFGFPPVSGKIQRGREYE